MTFLYVFMGIIVVGLAALLFFKIKWSRADNAKERGRVDRIEDERVEEQRVKKERLEDTKTKK